MLRRNGVYDTFMHEKVNNVSGQAMYSKLFFPARVTSTPCQPPLALDVKMLANY